MIKFLFIYNFFERIFIMKVVENSPQNARNCTIFKKISWGSKPPYQPARDKPLRAMTMTMTMK